MALFLDSADLEEARQAAGLGFVAGITTNPALMAKVTTNPLAHLEQLTGIFRGLVFYQLADSELEAMLKEGRQANAVAPGNVVLKIPCTLTGLTVVSRLSSQIPCAVTAVYTPQQGWLAAQSGARYVIPYINRTRRLGGNPQQLVKHLALVLSNGGSKTEILAASLKTPEEALETLEAGAQHLTVPLELIKHLAEHPWSKQAIDDFSKAAGQAKGQTTPPPAGEKTTGTAAPGPAPSNAQAGAAKAPQTESEKSPFNNAPFNMLDYIVGKIKLEELLAGVNQKELEDYLAERELDKLKEEEEITARLEELKKRLSKKI